MIRSTATRTLMHSGVGERAGFSFTLLIYVYTIFDWPSSLDVDLGRNIDMLKHFSEALLYVVFSQRKGS